MSDFLYGMNPVFEVLLAGRRQVARVFLASGSTNPRLKKLENVARTRGVPVEWCDKAKLFDLCQTREHQGAVAEAGPFPYTPFAEMLECPRLVLLDNLEDPHNVGAIMRTAEALGWQNVLLPRRGVPLLIPSVLKASAGAGEHLRIAVNCSANQYVKIALESGYVVVALDGAGKESLEDIRERNYEKVLLVCGGEDAGVSQFILNTATCVAAIRQRGRINSLNASVAAALAMYTIG
ncbi:MAG: RNA methyltransferase [Victivallales bacterium]|nr:RNA methyltransferase [Victivallales bacterium]